MTRNLKISHILNWKDYRSLFIKDFLKTPIFILFFIIALYNIISLLVMIIFRPDWDLYQESNPYFLLTLFLLVLILIPAVYTFRTKVRFDRIKEKQIEFSFNDESVSWKNKKLNVESDYSIFKKIENRPSLFIFYTSKRDFFAIQKKELSDKDITELHQILSKQPNYLGNRKKSSDT